MAKKKLPSATKKRPVRVFVSYCHKDESWQTRLQVHLAPLIRDNVTIWFDGDLTAGDTLDTEIARELRQADVFVALLSPDYIHSNYCWNIEYKRAMGRMTRKLLRVVGVVVRPCSWPETRAARFKLLPKDARPVNTWSSADVAFVNVAEGLRAVVSVVRKEAAAALPKPRKGKTIPAKKASKSARPVRSKATGRTTSKTLKRKPRLDTK